MVLYSRKAAESDGCEEVDGESCVSWIVSREQTLEVYPQRSETKVSITCLSSFSELSFCAVQHSTLRAEFSATTNNFARLVFFTVWFRFQTKNKFFLLFTRTRSKRREVYSLVIESVVELGEPHELAQLLEENLDEDSARRRRVVLVQFDVLQDLKSKGTIRPSLRSPTKQVTCRPRLTTKITSAGSITNSHGCQNGCLNEQSFDSQNGSVPHQQDNTLNARKFHVMLCVAKCVFSPPTRRRRCATDARRIWRRCAACWFRGGGTCRTAAGISPGTDLQRAEKRC